MFLGEEIFGIFSRFSLCFSDGYSRSLFSYFWKNSFEEIFCGIIVSFDKQEYYTKIDESYLICMHFSEIISFWLCESIEEWFDFLFEEITYHTLCFVELESITLFFILALLKTLLPPNSCFSPYNKEFWFWHVLHGLDYYLLPHFYRIFAFISIWRKHKMIILSLKMKLEFNLSGFMAFRSQTIMKRLVYRVSQEIVSRLNILICERSHSGVF